MLKIPKGLKKKKKADNRNRKNNKKGKKEQEEEEEELFDAKELEKYRQEQQQQRIKGAERASVPHKVGGEDDDQWKKFNALTAGVDDILQKTQTDLNRIKSTSFFQRKSPKPAEQGEKDNQEHLPDACRCKRVTEEPECYSNNNNNCRKVQCEEQIEAQAEGEKEEEEEEEEEEDNEEEDIIFDTSYVDSVTSGEIKLAYVPESPTREEADFDPFDTSIAERFIKSKPNQRYLNLGCAVQVLTATSTQRNPLNAFQPVRRSPKPTEDLLLDSFNEESVHLKDTTSPVAVAAEKTLRDKEEELIIPSFPIVPAGAVIEKAFVRVDEDDRRIQSNAHCLEFETSEEEDEFDKLAVESLAKKLETVSATEESTILPQQRVTVANFEFKAEEKQQPPLENTLAVEEEQENEDVDPFDTSVSEKLLAGKRKSGVVEKQLLLPNLATTKDPLQPSAPFFGLHQSVAAPAVTLKTDTVYSSIQLQAVCGSTPVSDRPDFFKLTNQDLALVPEGSGGKPLTPATFKYPAAPVTSSCVLNDPFDTSEVKNTFGKTELKLLEQQLGEYCASAPARPSDSAYEKLKVNSNISSSEEKVGARERVVAKSEVNKREDILTGGEAEELGAGAEVTCHLRTPVEPKKFCSNPQESKEEEYDPFDTSVVEKNIKPGRAELKFIENQLSL